MAAKWNNDVLNTSASNENGGHELLKDTVYENAINKRELQELNQKFSKFLDRIRSLETSNQNLDIQLLEGKKRWASQISTIREDYLNESLLLKKKINEAENRNHARLLKTERAAFEKMMIKHKSDLIKDLISNDGELLSSLTQERNSVVSEVDLLLQSQKCLKDEIQSLAEDLEQDYLKLLDLRREFSNIIFEKSKLRAEILSLNEFISFIKSVNEEEIKRLKNFFSPQFDLMQFYRTELANAISGIRNDFEALAAAQQEEIASYYGAKIESLYEELEETMNIINEEKALRKSEAVAMQRLSNAISDVSEEQKQYECENNTLVTLINNLEHDLADIISDNDQYNEQKEDEISELTKQIQSIKETIQDVIDGNITLRFEINTYRHLLEREEERFSSTERCSFSSTPLTFSNLHLPTDTYNKAGAGENDSKRNKKASTCSISIELDTEHSSDFIVLKNNSAVLDHNLNGYLLIQRDSSGNSCCHYFARDCILKAGKALKVYSSKISPSSEASVVAVNVPEWLKGPYVETRLYDSEGEEKSILVNKNNH